MKHTVRVPKELSSLFELAEIQMAKIFEQVKHFPEKGTIEIGHERYLLVRAASLSYDFFDCLVNVYIDKGLKQSMEFARTFLFDFAHVMGKKDAEYYSQQLALSNPLDVLSAGPVHFAYMGWAFVDISPESHPTPDHDYFILYDHIYSFESDSWCRLGKKADIPICIMNAGYSSGWCEASFKVPLVAVEILCKAKGDDTCRFIMAPPEKINGYIKKYLSPPYNTGSNKKPTYNMHNFYRIEQYQKKIRDVDRKLKESEEKFRAISACAKEGIILMDNDGVVIFWNRAAEKILGYTSDDVVGKHLEEVIVPAKFKSDYEMSTTNLFVLEADVATDKVLTLEALTKNCQLVPVELSLSSTQIGGLWHTVALMHDIKDRRLRENKLLRERAAINATKEGIIITDDQGNILDANPAFTNITGHEKEPILGQNMSILFPEQQGESSYLFIWHNVLVKGMWEGDLWLQRKNKEKYAVKMSINSIKNSEGEVDQYVAILADITARQEAVTKIIHQSMLDPLTSILNRVAFMAKIDEAINLCYKNNKKAALMFVDIDFFKTVNDKYGHTLGDQLLQVIVARLAKCIRNADDLARLGGDEFAILLHDTKDIAAIKKIAKKICKAMAKPFSILNNEIFVSASVGIAVYPDDAEDANQLIKRSDEAMYRIKNSTRDGYDFWGVL